MVPLAILLKFLQKISKKEKKQKIAILTKKIASW